MIPQVSIMIYLKFDKKKINHTYNILKSDEGRNFMKIIKNLFHISFMVAILIAIITGLNGFIWLYPLLVVTVARVIFSVFLGVSNKDTKLLETENMALYYTNERLHEMSEVKEDMSIYEHSCNDDNDILF